MITWYIATLVSKRFNSMKQLEKTLHRQYLARRGRLAQAAVKQRILLTPVRFSQHSTGSHHTTPAHAVYMQPNNSFDYVCHQWSLMNLSGSAILFDNMLRLTVRTVRKLGKFSMLYWLISSHFCLCHFHFDLGTQWWYNQVGFLRAVCCSLHQSCNVQEVTWMSYFALKSLRLYTL